MQIKILNGIYTDQAGDVRAAYPRNFIPVPAQSGVSTGYLRPGEGLVEDGQGPGLGRGGIEWNGVCYRVMGNRLVKILNNNSVVDIGPISGSGEVTLDYSFDYLAICGGGNAYLYDGTTLQQITDTDLGTPHDLIWVDGYFLFTDGEFIIATDLNNPLSINPLRYGSSEVDPDPIKAILKLRNEPQVLNRYTIEAFDNIGGPGFPFQRIDGAQIARGTIGTHTCCVFLENIAFIGGGRNEALAVWLGSNGNSTRISTREIDMILNSYGEATLSQSLLEPRVWNGHQMLYIHLPDRALVYDGAASQALGEPVWFTLDSGLVGFQKYRAKNFVRCYESWLIEDSISPIFGHVTDAFSTHYGEPVAWEFSTPITYNEGNGAIFHELELVCLNGRSAFGVESSVSTSYSTDGMTFGQEKTIMLGARGDRNRRLVWFKQGFMRNMRIQKFKGTSDGHLSVLRLEAQLEPLGV